VQALPGKKNATGLQGVEKIAITYVGRNDFKKDWTRHGLLQNGGGTVVPGQRGKSRWRDEAEAAETATACFGGRISLTNQQRWDWMRD